MKGAPERNKLNNNLSFKGIIEEAL